MMSTDDNYESVREASKVIRSHHFDTTKWDRIALRDSDVVVATAYKSGTTWVQNILKELLYFDITAPEAFAECCIWLDFRHPSIEIQSMAFESYQGRRVLKTHSPIEAIPFSSNVKYIYVGRDARDCFMSLVNQYRMSQNCFYDSVNSSEGLVGPPFPVFNELEHNEIKLFDRWIGEGWPAMIGESDGWPFWSLFDNVASWWQMRKERNVLFVHFNDLKTDLLGQIARIASFIEVDASQKMLEILVDRLTFDALKQSAIMNPQNVISPPGIFWENGLQDFFHKGENGRWKSILSEEQHIKYENKAKCKLSSECKLWLEDGLLAIDPREC